ncbi:MAG: flagellar basal-body MS-ring/collar protein FliF [Pseudomonadota bacterium]
MDGRRRFVAILATVALLAAIVGLVRVAAQPRMSLLYAGLEPMTAGEVVAALEADGAAFDIRGGAIYVDAARRDALRMTLAGQGLPSNGAAGYELLDTLSGFGTTSQMFDAAYWRAKEGELARTIAANRQLSAVRVHLSNPSSDPFARGQVASASVSFTNTGAPLTGTQILAFRHLVAAAVSGLNPDQVAVIDARNGLIPHDVASGGAPGAGSDGTAENLRRNVMRLLEARVGAGKAIVEVNVDTVTEREMITERRIDPDSRVAISSDTEETTNRANDARSGSVTVASNLPEGDAGASGGSSESSEARTREVVNYEVSETQRDILREPGAIRRVSVAVLVDGVVDPESSEWQARGEDELSSLRDLVGSAIGFDESRGDMITIKSLRFEDVEALPEVPLPGVFDRIALDVMGLIQLAVLAAVTLILGLFVVRPLLLAPPRAPAALPPPDTAGSGGLSDLPAIDGLSAPGDMELPALGALPPLPAPEPEDPSERLRGLIDERKEESVEVLSRWMRDQPESAG